MAEREGKSGPEDERVEGPETEEETTADRLEERGAFTAGLFAHVKESRQFDVADDSREAFETPEQLEAAVERQIRAWSSDLELNNFEHMRIRVISREIMEEQRIGKIGRLAGRELLTEAMARFTSGTYGLDMNAYRERQPGSRYQAGTLNEDRFRDDFNAARMLYRETEFPG